MRVWLYIFKVDDRLAEECSTRYVVQAHRFGTPQSRWFAAESLVQIHQLTHEAFVLDWGDVEEKLVATGGFLQQLEMGEFEFARLFAA